MLPALISAFFTSFSSVLFFCFRAICKIHISPKPDGRFYSGIKPHHHHTTVKASAAVWSWLNRCFMIKIAFIPRTSLPHTVWKREHQRQSYLNCGNYTVPPAPRRTGGDQPSCQQRASPGANAPATVKPIHLTAGIVCRDVIIHPGIDRPLPETEWNRQ